MKPYYDSDGITIYHGDCRDVLPILPDVGAIVTDPPYGTEDLGSGYGRRQLNSPDGHDGFKIKNDSNGNAFSDACVAAERAMGGVGWFISFSSPRKRRDYEDFLIIAGAEIVGEVVWLKNRFGLGYTIRYGHESIIVAKYGNVSHATPLLSVIHGSDTNNAMRLRNHPTEKPVDLIQQLVEFVGDAEPIVDPFMGSGSTLLAAKLAGRKAIGIELDEKYCAIAVERLAQGVIKL